MRYVLSFFRADYIVSIFGLCKKHELKHGYTYCRDYNCGIDREVKYACVSLHISLGEVLRASAFGHDLESLLLLLLFRSGAVLAA